MTEVADEFSGVAVLLLLAAALVLLTGVKLFHGSPWTRALVVWGGPLPVLYGFIEGTRAPALLVLMAVEHTVFLYVLTKPEVLPCFRGQH